MEIKVNDKGMTVYSPFTLAQLAESLQLPSQGVAMAVNNQLIPHTAWAEQALREGDSVVVIQAACGG